MSWELPGRPGGFFRPGATRARIRDAITALAFRARLTHPATRLVERLNVVTFHRVLPAELARDYPIDPIVVTTDEFSWFLEFFDEHFTCATLREACDRWSCGERRSKPWLAITFDDGQRDNFLFARALLERRGFAATFFIPTAAVDCGEPLWHDRLAWAVARGSPSRPEERRELSATLGAPANLEGRPLVRRALNFAKELAHEERLSFVAEWEGRFGGPASPDWDGMMSWGEIRALADAGHEIGSHSSTHSILTSCSDRQLEVEVNGSREALMTCCRVPVDSFCYPNGDHDSRVVAALRRAGYARAVTTLPGANVAKRDLLTLRRCDLQGRTARSATGRLSTSRVAWRLAR